MLKYGEDCTVPFQAQPGLATNGCAFLSSGLSTLGRTGFFLDLVLGLALGPAWFGWLLAIWTPLVCVARVMTGVHYVSDILGGIALGLLLGLAYTAISPLWIQAFPFLF